MLKADATGPLRPPAPRGPLADPPAPDLGAMDLGALRALRRDAQREEADLSYLRRMLHGRIDILHAELARRGCPERPETGPAQGGEGGGGSAGGASADGAPAGGVPAGGAVGAGVAGSGSAGSGSGGPGTGGPGTAGADAPVVDRLPEILTDGPSRVRSSARHVTLGTPLTERVRLLAEEMLSEVELSDLDARTDPELDAAMARLARHEQQVSRRRQTLQRTVDGCSAEITRRYRTGEAHVEDLLTES
jgi:hypothetical protein